MTSLAARIEAAVARVEAIADADAREAARDALAAVLDLHREGLVRLSRNLKDLRDAAADPLVESLFALHDVPLAPDPSLVPVERLLARREPRHERCELCAVELAPEHEHVHDDAAATLRCACAACALLFDRPGAKMRRVQKQVRRLDGFRMTDAQWSALEVPVALAFLWRSSSRGAILAAYPGAAGAVQAVVPSRAWEDLSRDNPVLAELEPDLGALLVDRRGSPPAYYVASMDECYRLAGLVRAAWTGLSGGDGPARAVKEFFEDLEERRA